MINTRIHVVGEKWNYNALNLILNNKIGNSSHTNIRIFFSTPEAKSNDKSTHYSAFFSTPEAEAASNSASL